jgi:prepilin-type N-terminal cleavage/methylation domain-containing protein
MQICKFIMRHQAQISVNKNLRANSQAGFTLLEILVVMIIIGVLVGLGLSSFRTSQIKSKDAKRIADLDQIANALETYFNDKGYYPVDNENGQIKIFFDSDDDGDIDEDDSAEVVFWGDKFYDPAHETTIYMGNLPQDTANNRQYYYKAFHREYDNLIQQYELSPHEESMEPDDYKAEAFRLYTRLENEDNSKIIGEFPLANCNSDAMEKTLCNYVVSSTNLLMPPTVTPTP